MSTKTIFTFFIILLIECLSEVKSDDSRIPQKQNSFVNFPTQQELLRQQQQHEIQTLRDQSSNIINEGKLIMANYINKKFTFSNAEQDTIRIKLDVLKKLLGDRILRQSLQETLDLEKDINKVAKDFNEYLNKLPQRPSTPPVQQQVAQPNVNQQRFAQQSSIPTQQQLAQPNINQQQFAQQSSIPVQQQVAQPYNNQQLFAQQPSIQMQRAPPQPSYGNNFNRNGRPNQFGKK